MESARDSTAKTEGVDVIADNGVGPTLRKSKRKAKNLSSIQRLLSEHMSSGKAIPKESAVKKVMLKNLVEGKIMGKRPRVVADEVVPIENMEATLVFKQDASWLTAGNPVPSEAFKAFYLPTNAKVLGGRPMEELVHEGVRYLGRVSHF